MTLPNSVAPFEGSPRRRLSQPPRLAKADPLPATPARLKRPQGVTPRPAKFISLAQYEAGYANRDQWPILWPHLHARPAPRRPRQAPAPLHPPKRLATVPVPSPPVAESQNGQSSPAPETDPVSHPPSMTPPFPPHQGETQARKKTRTHRAVKPPASTQPTQPQPQPQTQVPKQTPATTLSAWQRVCENKGVQRALAIGKLAADALDLLGAMIVSPITGAAIYDVVLKNLKADGQQLLTGKPARAPAVGTTTASRGTGAAADLVSGLSDARDCLKKFDPLKARKLQGLRRAAWGRGLTFAASLFMIGASGALAAANPALGGVAVVLSVYTARQAYANWRLARENLNHLLADRPTSPMGSNALAHVLNQAYLQERQEGVSPSEIQARAARSAAMVGVATVAASVAVGGVSMTAGTSMPALVSHIRHAVRGVGGVAAPVTEVVDSYVTEERSADLTKKRGFDQVCSLRWQAFFSDQSKQVAVYQSALGRYVDYQQGPLPRPRPCHVTVGATTMDIGPLIRWTRETRRLADLQAWLALDAQRTGDLNWAQRVFEDLEAIDGNRVKLRGTSVLGALASAAPSAVSLAL